MTGSRIGGRRVRLETPRRDRGTKRISSLFGNGLDFSERLSLLDRQVSSSGYRTSSSLLVEMHCWRCCGEGVPEVGPVMLWGCDSLDVQMAVASFLKV